MSVLGRETPSSRLLEPPPGCGVAEAFACLHSAGHRAMVGVTEHLLMADAEAAPVLAAFGHREIWRWAHDQTQYVMGWQPLPFLDGRKTRLLWTELTGLGAISGAVVELAAAALPVGSEPSAPALDRVFPGSSDAAVALRARLALATSSGLSLMVTGEPGVGKDVVAARLIELQAPSVPSARTVDPLAIRGEQALHSRLWLGRLRDAVERRRPIVFHDLDLVPDFDIHLWLPHLQRAADARIPVVATRALDMSEFALRTWGRVLRDTVVLPPLRARLDDLECLSRLMLEALYGRDAPQLAPETLRMLRQSPWPGNLSELRSVLVSARQRGVGPRLEPWQVRLPGGTVVEGSIAEAERKAIARAMEQSANNKQAAASLLGISRSTLYRKLRSLGAR